MVIFYGENPEPLGKTINVKNTVLGLYGEDTRITSRVHELVKALVECKKGFTIKVYAAHIMHFSMIQENKLMMRKQ
ncbi:MAG: dienelactone hydrolase family protein [Candidatus Parvarchaeota archaeon]|nr:dienelactone hydrolase family protein [Candidatus Parvarchaeota archaeon]MCL5420389.1 dienelactone hydrolase family protein [Candidatus Parvarchaeota archaeon]